MIKCVIDSSFPKRLSEQLNDILIRSIKHDDSYYFHEDSKDYYKLKQIVKSKSVIYRFYDSIDVYKSYRVCPTLLASMGKFSDSIPVILDDFGIRKITPYECLALQGFPKEFKFAPKTPLDKAYKQCGNSVVVPVIKRIAQEIKYVLTNRCNYE